MSFCFLFSIKENQPPSTGRLPIFQIERILINIVGNRSGRREKKLQNKAKQNTQKKTLFRCFFLLFSLLILKAGTFPGRVVLLAGVF